MVWKNFAKLLIIFDVAKTRVEIIFSTTKISSFTRFCNYYKYTSAALFRINELKQIWIYVYMYIKIEVYEKRK